MPSARSFAISAALFAAALASLGFIGSSSVEGLRTATLVTARFSGLLFAIALVSRASRPIALAQHRAELMLAFVAAHGVHFGAVLARAMFDSKSDFHNLKPQTVLSFAIGFSLIGVLAFTIRARTSATRVAHSVAIYVIWTIFILGFFSGRRQPASAAMLVVVVAAMLIRIALGISGRSKASSASA